MSSFFQFTQGTESRVRPNDTSPLLGRFRAVPPRPGFTQRRSSQLGLLSDRISNLSDGRGSVHVGYGALVAAQLSSEDDDVIDDDYNEDDAVWEKLWHGWVMDLWVNPKQIAVKRTVDRWWSRYGLLVFLPAALVRLPPLCQSVLLLEVWQPRTDNNHNVRPLDGVQYPFRNTPCPKTTLVPEGATDTRPPAMVPQKSKSTFGSSSLSTTASTTLPH
jgi:hypothetical protein